MTDTTVEAPATPRLKVKYNEQIIPELEKESRSLLQAFFGNL